jgi:nitrite reductase (cytochrome c-552)
MTETARTPRSRPSRTTVLVVIAFVLGFVALLAIAALLANIATRQAEGNVPIGRVVDVEDGETDPSVWGQNFPHQYDRFMMTENDSQATKYGGSVKYDKLTAYPAMPRLWAGYAFGKDHFEERGHFYSLIDQKESGRLATVQQPGACANCHTGDAPNLIREMGWEAFNRGPYDEIADRLHSAVTCNDCHDPDTMALRITRPAFVTGAEAAGIDLEQASRQDMRTYVCAQCHVEYYFRGEDRILTFPWEKGLGIDDMNEYYDEYGFRDWVHEETGAPMLKVQHPEFELYSTGTHAGAGVSCADCHLPYIRQGALKVSDHWIRSPLLNVASSCQTCHPRSENELMQRVLTIQDRTADQLRRAETAIIAAIDAIKAAMAAGATDEDLAEARDFQRRATLRWDFISSDNSTGFHSAQESVRVLADATNYARMGQLSAERVLARLGGEPPADPLIPINEPAVIGGQR